MIIVCASELLSPLLLAYYMEKLQWFLTIQEKYGVWAFQCGKG
jgi:hypothetical protein